MSYFNNPRTEEELKEQFRKLLIKYNYRDPKNEKLISAIRKEYEEKLLQIKRANGYQTLGDKAVNLIGKAGNAVKEYSKELEREQQREQQRIAGLKNRKYTKQEYAEFLKLEKKYIDSIVQNAVRQENVVYLSLKAKSKLNDNVVLYRFFVGNSLLLQTADVQERLNLLREKIEYATESFSQNRKQYNDLTVQLENVMGKYIADCVYKYEEMYVDPIEIQRTDKMYKTSRFTPKTWNHGVYMVLTIPAYIMAVICTVLSILLGDSSPMVFTICALAWAFIMEVTYRLLTKPLEKRKARVRTHEEAVGTERFLKGFARFLSTFLR